MSVMGRKWTLPTCPRGRGCGNGAEPMPGSEPLGSRGMRLPGRTFPVHGRRRAHADLGTRIHGVHAHGSMDRAHLGSVCIRGLRPGGLGGTSPRVVVGGHAARARSRYAEGLQPVCQQGKGNGACRTLGIPPLACPARVGAPDTDRRPTYLTFAPLPSNVGLALSATSPLEFPSRAIGNPTRARFRNLSRWRYQAIWRPLRVRMLFAVGCVSRPSWSTRTISWSRWPRRKPPRAPFPGR